MKLWHWLVITTPARLPSIVTSTISGNALGMGNFTFAVLVFGGTLLLSAGGLLLYHKICRQNEVKRNGNNPMD